MDSLIVRNAIGGLDKLLSRAKQALWELSGDVYGWGDAMSGFEHPRFAMVSHLEELHDILLVVLEAAQMPEARSALVTTWSGFSSADGSLGHTDDDEEDQECHSPRLTFLDHVIKGLRMTVSEEITSEQAWTLSKLEAMLEDTPALVHRKGKPPGDELELQAIMHDYLSACFADFRQNPPIGGTLKNFKPDCGIASVEAAIEIKIAHTKQQAMTSFTGVVEDTGGYKGSKDYSGSMPSCIRPSRSY